MAKKRKKLKKKQIKQTQSSVDVSARKEKSDKSIQDFDTLMSEINAEFSIRNDKSVEKDKKAETKKEESKTTISALPTIVCFPDRTEFNADDVEECKTKELELKQQTKSMKIAANSAELKELAETNKAVIESDKVANDTLTKEGKKAVDKTVTSIDAAKNKKDNQVEEKELTNPTVVFYPTNCEKMNLNPSTENGTMKNALKFDDISEQDDYQIHQEKDKQLDKDLSESDKEDIIDETGDELTELQETDSDDNNVNEKNTKLENNNFDKFDLFYQDQRHQYLVDTDITILVVLSILAVLSFIGWI